MLVKEKDFTKGKLLPDIIRFSIPCLIMNLIQSMFILTDLFIIGHWTEGGSSIAAITISSSPIWLHMIFLIGLGGGVNILIGRSYGAKEFDKMRDIVGTSMTLFAITAVILTLDVVIFGDFFIKLLNTPEEVVPIATEYLKISAFGFLPIALFNLLGAILRGMGNSNTPLIYISVGLILNVILDVLFVVEFNMGSTGAAIATVISQFSGCLFAIFYLRIKKFMFVFKAKDFCMNKDIAKNIFKLSLPISTQEIIIEISFMIIMVLANTLGTFASAGYGIVLKLWSFAALPAYSFEIVLAAVASQNIGAKKLKRAKEALYWCFLLSSVPCWLYVTTIFFIPEKIMSIFTNDAEVIRQGTNFLSSSSWEMILLPFIFCMGGFFASCGKTIFTMSANTFVNICVRVPSAFIFTKVMNGGLFMLGWSFVLSTSVLLLIFTLYFRSGRWAHIKT